MSIVDVILIVAFTIIVIVIYSFIFLMMYRLIQKLNSLEKYYEEIKEACSTCRWRSPGATK